MIKVTLGLLEKQPVELQGEEPIEFFGIEPSSSLAVVSPLSYRLVCRLISGSVLAEGSFSYRIAGVCGRCLCDVEQEITENHCSLFFETPESDELDLTEALREETLLALPMNLVCADDCAGLCPTCGVNLNTESCDCAAPEPPPEEENPWGALDQLKL